MGDIAFELDIGGFQLGDGFFQLIRKRIDTLSETPDLIAPLALIFRLEIKRGHFVRNVGKLKYGLCKAPADKYHCDDADQHDNTTDNGEERTRYLRALLYIFKARADEYQVFVAQIPDQIDIVGIDLHIIEFVNIIGALDGLEQLNIGISAEECAEYIALQSGRDPFEPVIPDYAHTAGIVHVGTDGINKIHTAPAEQVGHDIGNYIYIDIVRGLYPLDPVDRVIVGKRLLLRGR